MNTPNLSRELAIPFDDALARVTAALAAEGFGLITQVDLQEAFRQKLGVEFRRYNILGACNPHFAHEALGIEPRMGLAMPCNVIVYETDHGVTVSAVDPERSAAAIGEERLAPLSRSVRHKLEHALARLDKA